VAVDGWVIDLGRAWKGRDIFEIFWHCAFEGLERRALGLALDMDEMAQFDNVHVLPSHNSQRCFKSLHKSYTSAKP